MHFSIHFPTSELEKDFQLMQVGLKNAGQWADFAISMSEKPLEYVNALEGYALNHCPDDEHKKVSEQFEKLRLGFAVARLFKQQNTQQNNPNAPVEERPSIYTIAVDPELARLASALKLAPQFRVWMVLLQMVRNRNQLRISRADFGFMFYRYGIRVSSRNLRRWLRQGHGIFWNITDAFIYFIGYENVAHALVKIALERGLPDLVNTNPPGKRGMFIDVSGSLQQFEANIYAAWLAYREDPTIARSTLSALFNRAPRILRQWEQLAAVKVITNEAQFDRAFFVDVPEHAYLYQASVEKGRTETRFRARMSNTYKTGWIKQHHKRGQSRRVFRTIGAYLESIEPTGDCEQGRGSDAATGGLKPTGRRYFTDRARARSHAKHKGERERYLFLGVDKHKRNIWDYVADGIQRTRVGEELPLRRQRQFTPQAVYARDVLQG